MQCGEVTGFGGVECFETSSNAGDRIAYNKIRITGVLKMVRKFFLLMRRRRTTVRTMDGLMMMRSCSVGVMTSKTRVRKPEVKSREEMRQLNHKEEENVKEQPEAEEDFSG